MTFESYLLLFGESVESMESVISVEAHSDRDGDFQCFFACKQLEILAILNCLSRLLSLLDNFIKRLKM